MRWTESYKELIIIIIIFFFIIMDYYSTFWKLLSAALGSSSFKALEL